VSVRKVLLIPVIVILASAVVASAASLDLSSSHLGAGSATVDRCQANDTDVDVDLDAAGNATITDIDPACAGSDLQLVLLDEGGQLLGIGVASSIIVTGDTVIVPVTPVDDAELDDVDSAHIALAGRP
jgi:hypothetical protein